MMVVVPADFWLLLYKTTPITTAAITSTRTMTIVPQLALLVLESVFGFGLTLMRTRAS